MEWDSEYPLEGLMFETGDVFDDATAAKCAAMSGVCICGYLEVRPVSWLVFDCFEVDGSVVVIDGGDDELVIAILTFWVVLVFDIDELRCGTAI